MIRCGGNSSPEPLATQLGGGDAQVLLPLASGFNSCLVAGVKAKASNSPKDGNCMRYFAAGLLDSLALALAETTRASFALVTRPS